MTKGRTPVKATPSKAKGKNRTKTVTLPVYTGTGGRPEIVIDSARVRQLAMEDVSIKEIALILGVGLATLERRFADPIVGEEFRRAYAEGKLMRRVLLVRKAHHRAINEGSDKMLTELLRQVGYLNYSKTVQHQHQHAHVFADLEQMPIEQIELRVRELTIKVRNAAQLASSEREPLAEAIEGKEADATQQER